MYVLYHIVKIITDVIKVMNLKQGNYPGWLNIITFKPKNNMNQEDVIEGECKR